MPEEGKKQFDKPSNLLLLTNNYLKIISYVIIVITLLIGYFLLLNPKINIIQSTRVGKIPEVQRKEEELKTLIEKVNKLELKYTSIKNDRVVDLDKLYKIIPENPDIANIFLRADRLANENGFQLLALDILEPSKKEINRKKSGEEKNIVKEDPFQSLIIHMVVAQIDDKNDAYSGFKKYLNSLENSLRLMDIETVSFESFAAESEGSSEAESFQAFNFSIITYFNKQKDEENQ